MSATRPRVALWLSRGVLVVVAAILTLISQRYLRDPVGGAAERGIVLSSPLAATIARVGFGAFPLACAIIVAWCLAAADRLRAGLWFVVILFGTVLVVRVAGAVVDKSLSESIPLIIPEVVFLALTATALIVGSRPAEERSWPDARRSAGRPL